MAAPVQGKYPPLYSLLCLWSLGHLGSHSLAEYRLKVNDCLSPNLGPECYFGGQLLYIDIESNWEDMVARSLETPAT